MSFSSIRGRQSWFEWGYDGVKVTMMDAGKLAGDILKHVGGKENVKELTHCFTRLRFVLKDEEKRQMYVTSTAINFYDYDTTYKLYNQKYQRQSLLEP